MSEPIDPGPPVIRTRRRWPGSRPADLAALDKIGRGERLGASQKGRVAKLIRLGYVDAGENLTETGRVFLDKMLGRPANGAT